MALKITRDGWLDLSSVREATDDEINHWVSSRLMGTDTLLPSAAFDEDRHLVVVTLHDRLPADDQRRLRRVVGSILREAVRDKGRTLSEEYLGFLMRLVEPLFAAVPERDELARLIVEFVATPALAPAVRRRALQALLGLGPRLPEGFWRSQYTEPMLGPVVLEGLGKEDASAALRFLVDASWTPAVEAATIALLPSWLDDAGRERVERSFKDVEAALPIETRRQLREELKLPTSRSLDLFDDPVRTFQPIATVRYSLN